MLLQSLIPLLSLTALCLSVPQVSLYAQKDALNTTPLQLGSIAFNETTGEASISEIPSDLEIEDGGKYCVGIATDGQFRCHSYVQLSLPLAYDVVLTTKGGNGELINISVKKSDTVGLHAVIKQASPGKEPVLRVSKVKVKEVVNDQGEVETVQDSQEEDNRSFIQKYWMYIVPVLIMVMMRSD